MSDREYASVPERITWTAVSEFHCPIDKAVLGVVATFCNFRTGEGWPRGVSLKTMSDRGGIPRRTLQRSLHRLERRRPPFIKGMRRHRHATRWDICLERLATHWIAAKVVPNLSATGGAQAADLSATSGAQQSATSGAQADDLSATDGAQAADLSATGGAPFPNTRSQEDRRGAPVPLGCAVTSSQAECPELEARGERQEADNDEASSATTARETNIRPGDRDPARRAPEPSDGRSVQPDRAREETTPSARVPVSQRAAPPRRRRLVAPGAAQQLTLVLDLSGGGDAAESPAPTREEIAAASLAPAAASDTVAPRGTTESDQDRIYEAGLADCYERIRKAQRAG